MTGFGEFCAQLEGMAKKFGQDNTMIRIQKDADSEIIRAYGSRAAPLKRAQSGLADVTELACTAAEHHPYWALLYRSSEIASAVLEKWDGSLSDDEVAEIRWHVGELGRALERMGPET